MNARDILEKLQRDAGYTDPQQILLVARILTDATALQARSLAGEDVAAEVATVKASAANLDERLRGVVANWWLGWTQSMLANALGVAVMGKVI